MTTIPLNRGLVALIDDGDFDRVSELRWWPNRTSPTGVLYACAYIGPRKTRKPVYLHRFVLSATPGQMVDHRNGNGLDNRKCNLRFCDWFGSAANTKLPSHNTTGFKGVSHHSGKYWLARIQWRKQYLHLGMFPTAREAALAYDAKAIELFGEFARTNAMLGLL